MLIDEVDDFLDRDKLIFNICQNKNNQFQQEVLDNYYEICKNVYEKQAIIDFSMENREYWKAFYLKSESINEEI